MRFVQAAFVRELLPCTLALLILFAAIAIATLSYSLYLLVVAWWEARLLRQAGKQSPIASEDAAKFCILIPAHNEELVLGAVLLHLRSLDLAQQNTQIIVVSDNSVDGTAAIAAASPGVEVWVREDDRLLGKPYALNWAIERLRAQQRFDAVVIMDADTFMDPEFLPAMQQAYREAGGRKFAAQGWYSVLNADENWRTGLMAGALGLVHFVRPLAREARGLSVGLKGNGMCFSADVLDLIEWRGGSLTEDIELGLDLIENYGIRVRFVPRAIVSAQMPVSHAAAATQRKRWEHGRREIVRRRALPLFLRSLLKLDRVGLDASIDLLIPPIAELAAFIAGWGALILVAQVLGDRSGLLPIVWIAALVGYFAYIIGGFRVSQAPATAYLALCAGPFYLVWKLFTLLTFPKRHAKMEWVRTERALIAPREGDAAVSIADEPVEVRPK